MFWKTKTKVKSIIKKETGCYCCNCQEYEPGSGNNNGYCPLIYWRYNLMFNIKETYYCKEFRIKLKWAKKYFADTHSRNPKACLIYRITVVHGVKRTPGMISDAPMN